MVEIRGFHPADVDAFEPVGYGLSDMDWRTMIRMAARSGPAWTGELDGRIIGCAGLGLLWQGRAQTWCVLAPNIPKRAWIGIHRAVAVRLAQMGALNIWRIEADALFGYLPGARWLRMLGFEQEGLARAYGPDRQDYLRFARVTD